MSRPENLAKGGFFAFPTERLSEVAKLFQRGRGRILDPCAGDGVPLKTLSDAWGLTPYAVELEQGRAEQCASLFTSARALQEDMFQASIAPNSMQVMWVNPPFTFDTAVPGARREFGMLKRAYQWLQRDGWLLFVSYAHHISTELAAFVCQRSRSVELYALPEKHFDLWTYTVLVAQAGKPTGDPFADAQRLHDLAGSEHIPLITEASGSRLIPAPEIAQEKVYFHRGDLNKQQIIALVKEAGADQQTPFLTAMRPAPEFRVVKPAVRPKLGHMVTLIAAGMFNNLVLDLDTGRAVLRSTVHLVEEIIETEEKKGGKIETIQIKPKTTIALTYADGRIEKLEDDATLQRFIRQYKAQLFAHAERWFKPQYEIGSKSRWMPHLQRQRVKGKYRLFPSQQQVAAAVLTVIKNHGRALFVGEMSCGKTPTSLAMIDAWHSEKLSKPGQVFWINCPAHLVKKWKREASAQLPSARITMLMLEDEKGKRSDMLADLGAAMRQAEQESERIHLIIANQDAVKLGEGWEPAYIRKRNGNLYCPTTGEPLYDLSDTGDKLLPATHESLKRKQQFNGKPNPLWQEVRRYGKAGKIEPSGDAWLSSKGVRPRANPRGPVWKLLEARYRGRIAIAFFDESHESRSLASDRYRSMAAITRCADASVGLTGTLTNGYASSLFGMETLFNPSLFERYEWGNPGVNQWVRDMGILEKTIEYKEEYSASGYHAGTKRINHGAKEAAGIAPLAIPEIIDHTVFMSLTDLGKNLPSLEEIPVELDMSPEQARQYDAAESRLKDYLNACRNDGDVTFLARYFRSLLDFPDTAFRSMEVTHHKVIKQFNRVISQADILVHVLPGVGENTLLPKEEWLLEIIEQEIADGRGVAIFLQQTGTRDYQDRLEKLLHKHTRAQPVILRADEVKPVDREEWVEHHFTRGANTLICNPELVQTGLDLVVTPTLIFYEPVIKLSVLQQASRRHWRIPQEKACRTYYACYRDTMQHQIVQLSAKKMAAAAVISGDQATLSVQGGGGNLLKELMKGDLPVVDLQAEFKRINQRDWNESEWTVDEIDDLPVVEQAAAVVEKAFRRASEQPDGKYVQMAMF
jgi:hypothetical protein